MNTHSLKGGSLCAVVALSLVAAGCGRQSRGNSDAYDKARAATPAEGGATSAAGSAGESKNYGDTRAKTEADGRSPSASPTGLSKDTSAQHNVETSGAGAATRPDSQPAQPKPDSGR